MRTLQELGATTTATTGISTLQSAIWYKRVIQYSTQLRYFDQVAWQINDIVNTGDKTVHIPKTSSNLTIDTSPAAGEAGVRDWTSMDNLTTVDISIAASNFYRGGVEISKQAVQTSTVDLVNSAKYEIARGLAQQVDTALATQVQTGCTADHKVFGGDATAVTDIATGDTITADLIADAQAKIKANDFAPKYLFISPLQESVLLKDSQFVNAAEYGDREPILRGEIGRYLGLKILSTNNTPTYAQSATDVQESAAWAVAGNACPVIGTKRDDQPVALAIVWKEKPHIDYEYVKNEAVHRVFYDQAFNVGTIHGDSICLIKVSQS